MQKAFYKRWLNVFLFVLGVAMIVCTVTLLPAYFSANVKLSVAKDFLNIAQGDTLSTEEAKVLEMVKNLESKLEMIKDNPYGKFIVSERAVDDILARKTDDIKIKEIHFTRIPNKTSLIIEGNSKSRESLLNFRVALEKDPNWEKVDLPVSNFVRGADINFSLTLIPHEE